MKDSGLPLSNITKTYKGSPSYLYICTIHRNKFE